MYWADIGFCPDKIGPGVPVARTSSCSLGFAQKKLKYDALKHIKKTHTGLHSQLETLFASWALRGSFLFKRIRETFKRRSLKDWWSLWWKASIERMMTVACPFRGFLVSIPWKNLDACDSGVPRLNCIYKISLQSNMNCESLRNSAEALSMVRTSIFGGCWKYDLSKVHLVASVVSWIHGLMIFDEHFYVGQLLLRLLPSGVLETSSPKWSSTTCRHRTLAVWSAAATKTRAEKMVFWMLFVGGDPGWRFFSIGRVATIEVSLKHYVRNPHIEPTKKEKL